MPSAFSPLSVMCCELRIVRPSLCSAIRARERAAPAARKTIVLMLAVAAVFVGLGTLGLLGLRTSAILVALQMFGGYGLSREYPMEKLFRDARSLLVADGNNEVLAMKGALDLVNPDWL